MANMMAQVSVPLRDSLLAFRVLSVLEPVLESVLAICLALALDQMAN